MRVMLAAALVASAVLPTGEAEAQATIVGPGHARPDSRDGVLVRADVRAAWMVTNGLDFGDRPVFQVDVGAQFGRARVGAGPALALTGGVALGVGKALGERQQESLRVMGGVELPIALAIPQIGDQPVELVPVVQAGYQTQLSGGDRVGFTMRVALGLRFLPAASSLYLTFEPVSLVLLFPSSVDPTASSSRQALEFGLIKFGWRF
jgi:hypothetical protein